MKREMEKPRRKSQKEKPNIDDQGIYHYKESQKKNREN